MGSPGISNGVRGCFASKTFVAQCDSERVAEELLVQVLLVLFDMVGEMGLKDGGSGTGGKTKSSDPSDHTGDMFVE